MNFRVFEDDEDSLVADEVNLCSSNCGRKSRKGLNRLLRAYHTCCQSCQDSRGVRHSKDCAGSPNQLFLVGDPDYLESNSTSGTVSNRLNQLISGIPDPDSDLDPITAKSILDTLCSSNGIPCLDDKRFLLIFSRLAVRGKIPRKSGRQFLFIALRRIEKAVNSGIENTTVPRYFFVFKKTRIEDQYRFRSILGQGSFGVVHRVTHLCSGQNRVCKSIPKRTFSIPAHQLESEIRIIAGLDHPNVIRMHEFFEDEESVHIIMEYCTGGDLLNVIKDSIKTKNRIELETIRSILFQILRAVAFMSARRVIHKDLKPENIMLVPTQAKTSGPIIKVIDFGLSELFALDQETSNMVAGTAFYMAPEIFRPPFNNKCDVWSCGVIAFFLATGYLPFFGATVAEVKSNILYRRLQWPATFARTENPLEIAPDFKAFIERLMEKDPALRPSAVEALRDPWISQNGISMEISRGVAMNIVCFSRLSFLKRVVINLIAHIWHFSEFENIIEMFSALDTGNNGMVPVASLASAIEHKGFKSIDAWTAAKSLDLSGSGTITYTSFTAGVILPLIDSDKEILRCVFNSFNPILKDYITISAIYDVLVGRRCVMSGSAHAIKPDGFKDFTHMIEGEITVTDLSPDNFKAEKSSASIGGLTSKTLGISFTDFRNWLLTTA